MTRFNIHIFLFAIFINASFFFINAVFTNGSETAEHDFSHHKIYELRTYTTQDGKLNDLHQRFTNHTMGLFEKHGMENIGYWTPTDRENTLIYIVAHESREAAEKSWQAFRDDPEWQKAYKESREDGPIVEKVESVFMTNTEYSPME